MNRFPIPPCGSTPVGPKPCTTVTAAVAASACTAAVLTSLLIFTNCAHAAPSKAGGKPAVAPKTAASATASPNEAAALAGAKALFEKYVALERAFDPALGELYAPNAQVIAYGVDGQKLSFDGGMMREMLKTSMPLAKAQKDTVEYKNVSYAVDGAFVTITALRHSKLKNKSSPHRIVVASRDGKNWFVVQEVGSAAR